MLQEPQVQACAASLEVNITQLENRAVQLRGELQRLKETFDERQHELTEINAVLMQLHAKRDILRTILGGDAVPARQLALVPRGDETHT